ncbi:MAG TPA: 6-carboxytetrahydropterin synthase [Candidatus Limnocylindria bacterium]|nr:6-carboxytetrahydropterin synthase [Candidatus Limnocylindria bacterium]
MIEVGVAARFTATHRLRGDFGPATRRHRHDYRVEAVARGERVAADGTLVDLGRLQGALNDCLGDLDGRDLDALALFEGENTTAERVAAHVFDRLREALDGGDAVRSLRVTVYESDDAWAAVDRPLDG